MYERSKRYSPQDSIKVRLKHKKLFAQNGNFLTAYISVTPCILGSVKTSKLDNQKEKENTF